MLATLIAALHYLGLGIGLGAIFARGLALRALAAGDSNAVGRVLFADNFWGVAALLWVTTGLTRLFGGLDGALDLYLYNGLFWVKMGLFGLVLALEVAPMTAFIRWRVALRAGSLPDTRRARRFVRLNDAQTAIVMVIPFVAGAMARGLWLLE